MQGGIHTITVTILRYDVAQQIDERATWHEDKDRWRQRLHSKRNRHFMSRSRRATLIRLKGILVSSRHKVYSHVVNVSGGIAVGTVGANSPLAH